MSTTPQWRKSTHSSGEGGNCVEVARFSTAAWRKSTYSGGQGGNCVEVAGGAGVVGVRDSKDPEGPALGFTPREWRDFLSAVKSSAH
ncbi:MAG TPA: DUF397 domain-containing protein [Streptosporangiaceae bacterium]